MAVFILMFSSRLDNPGWRGADYLNNPALKILLRTFGHVT
jgi:hypothetical protein